MKVVWHMPTLRRHTCGLSIRAVRLAAGLCEAGHAVEFVVPADRTDVETDHIGGIPLRRLPAESVRPWHWSLQAIARRRIAGRQARRIAADHDVMISCQPEMTAALSDASNGRPVVFVCGGTTLLHDPVDRAMNGSRGRLSAVSFAIDRRLKHCNESHAFNAADAVVFDSAATRDRVLRRYRCDPERCHVVHGGVDPEQFRPADADARVAARRALGLAESANVVVWTGRLSPEKHVELLLHAVLRCRARVDAVLIVGDGPAKAKLEQMAAACTSRTTVRVAGAQADVRPFLHAADVFAFPSRSESFGGALVEAMACGLACVAIRPDGRRVLTACDEIIEHGRTGLLVDEPTPEALAGAIDSLLADAELRARLGSAARRIATAKFTWRRGGLHLAGLIADLERGGTRNGRRGSGGALSADSAWRFLRAVED